MSQPRGYPRSLDVYLSADPGLARLSAHARRLLKLQRIFESATPLARQSRVANLRLGKIIIHTANGAIATKLRQLEPRLIALFQNEAVEVTGINVRLQAGEGNQGATHRGTATEIGAQQKRALTSLASELPDGSSLKAALRRLVDRAK